MRKSYIKPL